MVAWTEYDHVNGFRYQIVDEGGSGYIRTKVLRAALDGEQKIWADREPQKSSFNHDNYMFDDGASAPDGLAAVGVRPKRKDVLLVEGALFVQPSDGELSRIEGKLSKTPSFWTRRVDVVRRYERTGRRARAGGDRVGRAGAHRRPIDVQDDVRVPDDQRTARRRSRSTDARSPKSEFRCRAGPLGPAGVTNETHRAPRRSWHSCIVAGPVPPNFRRRRHAPSGPRSSQAQAGPRQEADHPRRLRLLEVDPGNEAVARRRVARLRADAAGRRRRARRPQPEDQRRDPRGARAGAAHHAGQPLRRLRGRAVEEGCRRRAQGEEEARKTCRRPASGS